MRSWLNPPARRQFDDKRNVNGGVVNKEAVLMLAVLCESFAVIAHEQNQAAIINLITFEPLDQAAEFMVGISNLSVVEVALILAAVRLGRIIRAMRIVQMQPKEKWPPRILAEPLNRMVHALPRAAVHQSQISMGKLFGSKRVIIKIKAAS